jgi:hypothetical protein
LDDQTVMAQGQPTASLVVRQGAQAGMTFSIMGGEAVLGREEGIDVSVRDPEVSRRHARITWQNGSYYLEDLNSTNGTFLNGALVTSPQPLRSGDTIGIGQTVLVFQGEPGAAFEQPVVEEAYPSSQPAARAAEPASRERRNRCLLVGCGCLILLGVLVLVALLVLFLAFPQQFEDFLNSILAIVGLEADLAKLLAPNLLV